MKGRENRKAFNNTTIPGDWEISLLDSLAKRGSGHTPDKEFEDYYNGAVKWISLADSNRLDNGLICDTKIEISALGIKKSSAVLHPSGTVVLSRDAGVGKSAVMGTDMAVSQHFIVWRCKEGILDNWFLYHWLQFKKEYFERQAVGSTIKTIGLPLFKKLTIKHPKYPEQKAIARILNVMDTAINTNNQLIAQKELRKKWLMQHLLTGKKRLKGFDGEWKEIHIRDVSQEISIRNKADKQLTVLSCTKYDGLVPSLEYFGRKIFSDDVSTYKVVPKNHFAYATNHIEEGSIGYQEILDEALISPMYTVFKTDASINDIFFYKLLKSHKLVYQYQNRMEGSIDRRGGLRWDAFSIIKIHIPPIAEQTAIAQILQTADKEIQLLKAKTEQLRQQKKGMMQVLLTGKVRVKIK
jgi:type I restriction enzyme, S subunit